MTNPNIKNFKNIRKSIDTHFSTADNRLLGFDYLNKLFRFIRHTGQSKSIISPLASSLSVNPFVNIEASGMERLRKINNKLKETLSNLIGIFISDYNNLRKTVLDFIKSRIQGNARSSSKISTDEIVIISRIRGILECLSDMIIILTDNPAKDAFILHIVLEFRQGECNFSEFFTNLIRLILDTKDSLIILNKSHLSENLISKTQAAAKLLLNKFIILNTDDSQILNKSFKEIILLTSFEDHNLLQETLLENIIQMLKEEMKISTEKGKKFL